MRTYDINIIAQSRDAFTSVEVTQFLEREMIERGFQLISQRCEAQQGASRFGPGHSEAHQKQIDLLTQLEKAQAALANIRIAYERGVNDYDIDGAESAIFRLLNALGEALNPVTDSDGNPL